MAIDNWFGFKSSDSVSTQQLVFYYLSDDQQASATVSGGAARALACYVLCKLAVARGYTILSNTADFDAMLAYMDAAPSRSYMMQTINRLLDSILVGPAIMIGSENGGWGSNHCDVTVGAYSESDETCAFAVRTRTNDFARLGGDYSVDLIAACSILNSLSPNRSLLAGVTAGTGDFKLPLLSYTPGHYQHSDGKADWLIRAGKIGYMYHSAVNYGGGYGVFDDAISPLIWGLKSNPLAVKISRVVDSLYENVKTISRDLSTDTAAIRSAVQTAKTDIEGYINNIDASTIVRTSDLASLATSAQADAIAQTLNTCAKTSDLSGLAREVVAGIPIARSRDFLDLARHQDTIALAEAIAGCAQRSDLLDLAKTSDLDGLATSVDLDDLPNKTDISRLEKKVDDLKPSALSSAIAFGTGAIGLVADLKSLASSGVVQNASSSRELGGSTQRAPGRAQIPDVKGTTNDMPWAMEDEI